jgi:hypothetical protein
VVWIVLYVIALLAVFSVINIDSQIALWSWVIGFGLLLASGLLRDL